MTHPEIPNEMPSSEVEALLDAGRLIDFALRGYCDCTICSDLKRRDTDFAMAAKRLYDNRFSSAGRIFRALMEDWNMDKTINEFRLVG